MPERHRRSCDDADAVPAPELAEYSAEETLKDGSKVIVRSMRPDDAGRLAEAFLHLQPQTVRMRFFYAKKLLGEDELQWIGKIGAGKHFGLVATASSGHDEVIVGEGSYVVRDGSAEIAFTVADDWQGRGVASRLLAHLARIARAQGVRQFEADVLKSNAPMLAVFRHSGFPMATGQGDGVLRVTLLLESPSD